MGWFEYLSGEYDNSTEYERTTAEPQKRGWFEWLSGEGEKYPASGGVTDVATAYHEAGHGRAGRRGGFEIKNMEAFWDGSGVTRFSKDMDPNKLTPQQLKDLLIAGIAGQEAEIRYLMEYHGYRRKEAERATYPGTAGDRAIFNQLAAGTNYTWDKLKGEAKSRVFWNWGTIEKNAKKLYRKGKMGGTWA